MSHNPTEHVQEELHHHAAHGSDHGHSHGTSGKWITAAFDRMSFHLSRQL